MKLDGTWRIIEGDERYHRIRVFEDGKTWVHPCTSYDDPLVDYRIDGTTILLARAGVEIDQGELHDKPIACGTIDARDDSMELTWSRANYSCFWGHEVLVRDKPGNEPRPTLPRAREIDGIGVLTAREGRWRGRLMVDGVRHVDFSVDLNGGDEALAEGSRIVGKLRDGGYAEIVRFLGKDLLYDHKDWQPHNAARDAAELAERIRHDTIHVDSKGVTRLWFGGDVFTEHSFIAILKRDGSVDKVQRN